MEIQIVNKYNKHIARSNTIHFTADPLVKLSDFFDCQLLKFQIYQMCSCQSRIKDMSYHANGRPDSYGLRWLTGLRHFPILKILYYYSDETKSIIPFAHLSPWLLESETLSLPPSFLFQLFLLIFSSSVVKSLSSPIDTASFRCSLAFHLQKKKK